ncbi:related to ubiquitin carboxyl-terminal hydrolase [Fusarium torulosum]|uniref:Related to ubiquitin carboxyl-terminal hydrolase n=1 Tax=Fusarium torulosum TaxID=33205 RepID=A0AAE8SPH7_9HYPO|nr:related to ubiquitin carboxyl-terminal hydrolase [Fusarium torulosum]
MASLGHSRASSVATVGSHPLGSPGAFNHGSRPGGSRGGDSSSKPSFPHIDDVIAPPHDLDPNMSIRKLLETAEASLRQAEMARDFRRPTVALHEYIRASIIAVQTITKHPDYHDLKATHRDFVRSHTNLLTKISQQDPIYAKIKHDIVEDNKRSGVQPQSVRSSSSQGGSRPQTPSKPAIDGTMSSLKPRFDGAGINSSSARSKPTIQPKPQSLHGNAIKPGAQGTAGAPKNTPQDLAARFANLRGPQASPGQDPRIKTHQITLPKPNGPREMPPPRPPKVGIDTNMPTLPKMPDAIYSPARGSISGEVTRPPASTPRSMYNRTASTVSIPGTPTASSQAQPDYFQPTQSYSNNSIPPVPPTNLTGSIKIPDGNTITPEELYQAMKAKGSILIIDIRMRDDFNEGHILSSSTICIEPSILLRDSLSADDISESLILSPNQEQLLFEQRNLYDLVIFYDQDSEDIPQHPRSSDDLVIISLHRALLHFNYLKELKNTPKILKGGLDAWIDLMGPASLGSTISSTNRSANLEGTRNRSSAIERRRSKYIVKPLKPDEVKAWQEALKNEDIQTASSPNFTRTTEDFLRRFPPVSLEQQSMTSPDDKPQKRLVYGSSHKVDLYTDLPSPPTRPAPALPRRSYSGLTEGRDENELYGNNNAVVPGRPPRAPTMKAVEHQSTGDSTRFYTGLNNPHNWCYANSMLQSLLASPEFGRELANSEWASKYKAPRKDNEKSDHPQLMIRIVSNLFHWMNSGKFQAMKAQTLMDYSRHLCTQGRNFELFGGPQQQDAQEFMSFLFTHLHDETNTRRDRKGKEVQPDTTRQSLLRAAVEVWNNYIECNQSIIDRFWRGLELSTVKCSECETRTYRYTMFETFPVSVDIGRGMTLTEVLDGYTAPSLFNGFECDHCRHKTQAQQIISFARLPDLLCISFRRFHYIQAEHDVVKSTATVKWDLNHIDLTRYFLPRSAQDASEADLMDSGFTGRFHYETYAVIVHSGSRVNNGHYLAYVRDSSSHDPYAWHCCNDTQVTKVRIGTGDRDDAQEEVFKSGRDRVPYMVFLRRKAQR